MATKTKKSKKICLATNFLTAHTFEPGTVKEAQQMYDDCWEICGRSRKDERHYKY